MDSINQEYWKYKDNQDLINIINNFVFTIPTDIFIMTDQYQLFECLVAKDYDIAQKTLWTSKNDIERINILLATSDPREAGVLYSDFTRIETFVYGDFRKLVRLIKASAKIKDNMDAIFISLRFLQVYVITYFSQLAHHENEEFDAINANELTLDDCFFYYFSQMTKADVDFLEEPTITWFTFFLMGFQKFGEPKALADFNFLERQMEVRLLLEERKEEFEYRLFKENMTKKGNKATAKYIIADVDLMNGKEFEQFVANLFNKMGYKTRVTQHSRDFGVDVIAEKDGIKIGIQAKCYTGSVSNSAVQEIAAGMKHYNCDKGVVVTNSAFSIAAIKLAKSNSIQLWDRKILEEKILEAFQDG